MQAKHKFFLFVTYIYKSSETIYKFKKTSMYNYLLRKKWLKEKQIPKNTQRILFLSQCGDHPSHHRLLGKEKRTEKKHASSAQVVIFRFVTYIYKISKKSKKLFKKKVSNCLFTSLPQLRQEQKNWPQPGQRRRSGK